MHQVYLKNIGISEKKLPYIIAEIGVNHEGSMSKAKHLIDLCSSAGAHAAKFQTYKADTLASINSPAYWDSNQETSKNQHELFNKYDRFNEEDYKMLFEYCKQKGVEFLSTPFDLKSVDFLDPLLNFYKIASADLNNLPLLKAIAKKNKPIILSTGASNLNEIKFAVNFLEANGCPDVSLLHCILNYPTKYKNANLAMIQDLSKNFPNHTIGYSDHTLPDNDMITTTTAYLMGAQIIEKHFTYDKTQPGNDHYHAMDDKDLKILLKNLNKIHEITGYNKKIVLESEEISRLNARRSIVINTDVIKGEIINESMITTKRPGIGINPSNWDNVLGKSVNKNLKKDHILLWQDININPKENNGD